MNKERNVMWLNPHHIYFVLDYTENQNKFYVHICSFKHINVCGGNHG